MGSEINMHSSRRPTDFVREILISVLFKAGVIEFNEIFERVFEAMKKHNLATGGEEILRLRVYEKLQSIVSLGAIAKKGKVYTEQPKMAELYKSCEFKED